MIFVNHVASTQTCRHWFSFTKIQYRLFKGLGNPMMSYSLSPYVDDAKVADVVIPHALRRPHVQGPQYMHKFLLVDRSSNLYTNSF